MIENAIDPRTEAADVVIPLGELHAKKIGSELDSTIHHLVLLRASQINRCGYCIDMHIREAKAEGETDERLNHVIVWDESGDFTPREKAALAWTEALTYLTPDRPLAAIRTDLKSHFSDREIALLTSAIAMINMWNRMNISYHRPT